MGASSRPIQQVVACFVVASVLCTLDSSGPFRVSFFVICPSTVAFDATAFRPRGWRQERPWALMNDPGKKFFCFLHSFMRVVARICEWGFASCSIVTPPFLPRAGDSVADAAPQDDSSRLPTGPTGTRKCGKLKTNKQKGCDRPSCVVASSEKEA